MLMNPGVEHLRRQQVRRGRTKRLMLVVIPLVVLMVAAGAYVGFSKARSISLENEYMRLDPTPGTFEQVLFVHSDAVAEQHIVGASGNQRGVVTLGTSAQGKTLKPGTTMKIEVFYKVADCNAVLHGPYPRGGAFPVNLQVDRWWGTQTWTVFDQGGPFGSDALAACHAKIDH